MSSGLTNVITKTLEIMYMIKQDLEIADTCSVKERLESNMTPGLWVDLAAESVTLSGSDTVGCSNLASC